MSAWAALSQLGVDTPMVGNSDHTLPPYCDYFLVATGAGLMTGAGAGGVGAAATTIGVGLGTGLPAFFMFF
jgi:hypothetical protein